MSWVANSGAKMAMTATARMTVPPNITDGLERSTRHDSQSCCARACHDEVGTGALSQADSETGWGKLSAMGASTGSGVEDPVEQITDEVEADEDHTDQDCTADDGVHVAGEQSVGQIASETGPREHRFGQDRTLQQEGVRQHHDGDDLHHDVAEGVDPDRASPGQPLDARRHNIFLAELLDHEAASHAADVGDGAEAEDRGRQHDVAEHVL